MEWNASSIPNLAGKVAVVTGANAGIGLQTMKQLALHGATVYMGARSESRAKQAIDTVLSEHPSIPAARLIWLPLDLSKLPNILEAVQIVLTRENRLDILINNAGIAAGDFTTTEDGVELTMAVNHVGHFVLTTKLLPLLKTTASKPGSDVRVVTVSSAGEKFAPSDNAFMYAQDLNNAGTTDPRDYSSRKAIFRRYGTSKLANILFNRELQNRLDKEGTRITALTLDPGPVATEGGLGVFPGLMKPILKILMKGPEKGALTPLFCATASEVTMERERYKGQFLNAPGKIVNTSERSRDKKLAESLWRITEEILESAGVR